MTINPHLTDQFLAAVKDNAAEFPPPVNLIPAVVAMLREELPGADERVVGEIVLHAASLMARIAMVLEQRGYRADVIAPITATALAGAGAELYRGQVNPPATRTDPAEGA